MEKRVAVNLGNLIVTLLIIAAGIWAVYNRQGILDWWRLQSYKPTEQVVKLADSTSMVGRGRELFYVSEPAIEGRDSFNIHCTNHNEQSIVLGCYRAQQIYLFDVTDERLAGVEEVTAAHEMLHAAYERLSNDEKQRVNAMLDPQIKALADPRLLNLIKLYNKQEPGQLYNEMHSILGTEYRELSAELENYYKQYFSDRLKVVSYSERYEAVFTASQERIAGLDARLDELKKGIEANNAALETRQRELERDSDRLNALRQSNPEQYNQAVPGYNAQVREFNALVNQTKQLIDEFNALVEQRNKEAAAQNDLYHQLDSRYQSVPQT